MSKSIEDFFSLFDKKISIGELFKTFVVLLCIANVAWEFYWATKAGYAVIKWHTHLMPYVYLALVGLFIFRFWRKKGMSDSVVNYFLLFAAVLLSLFLVETFFVISGSRKTYMEQIAGYYQSPYCAQERSYYHLWQPGIPHWLTKPEFSYLRPTNSRGFDDVEWPFAKKPKEKRILALGDSFTEGDGAPFDSSFVSLLRQELPTTGDSFYLMNGGICGSDPFNNYINLKDLLLVYKPDIIIQSLGSADLSDDIFVRGGMERFQKDGTVKFRAAPWWEPIYAMSYISRIFFGIAGYDELLRKRDGILDEADRINRSVEQLFSRYSELCDRNRIELFVVFHPERGEIERSKYNYDFKPLLQYFASNKQIRVIDLLPAYRDYIAKKHSSADAYFWKHDSHHNAAGYKMMAETIFQNIGPMLNDSSVVANNNSGSGLSH